MTKNNKKTLLAIPVYNEEKNISKVLTSLIKEINTNNLNDKIDILVIDDCSTDNTNDILKSHNIKVIRNFRNIGYSCSLQLAYRYAINKDYQFLIQMDGDGQHDATNIINFYNKIQNDNIDILIGNRFEKSNIKIGFFKKFAIKYFSFIIKKTTGFTINDPTSGFQALKKSVVYYYSKYNQFDTRFPDSNVLLEAAKAGFIIGEIPVIMHERQNGKSMFKGFRPVYYMIYMTIATIIVTFRKDIKQRYIFAKEYAENKQ